MNTSSILPSENIAATVVASMTDEKILSSTRMKTGDQYFVYAVKTADSEYVIRMTNMEHKSKFISALYWQEKLIPLGIPLAKFIKYDLDGKHSPFPALLMMRLPGDDLCNVYLNLTDSDKKNLSNEIVNIQAATNVLPDGLGYGFADSYEEIPADKSWYDFLMNKLQYFISIIGKNAIFDINEINRAIDIAKGMAGEFRAIRARPFLYDASERNVIVYKGKISGIVDVDEICFGDPLFVPALTYVALANEGYDTLYTDYWAEALQLDKKAKLRLEFYRLYYTISFMRKHSITTANNQKINFNTQRLNDIFNQSLMRIKEFDI